MKTKFAIGCLVQWYEIEIVGEYIESLKRCLNHQDGEAVDVHFTFNINQKLEKIDTSLMTIDKLVERFEDMMGEFQELNCKLTYEINEDFTTIAYYRRWFLEEYCDKAEVLIQGETDALMPKSMFTILDSLHQQVKDQTPKYISTFGICKMWDNTWTPLEHTEFTDKPFKDRDYDNWWSHHYTMNIDEMDSFNDKVEDLQVTNVKPHKFNGCGFIISSEAVKAGVNIPKGTFFIDDTALGQMAQRILPNMPQYHFKNILIVHNRKHPKKRSWVLDEADIEYIDDKRLKGQNWYDIANQMCKVNDANIFNTNFKWYTWDDVWNEVDKQESK